MRPVEWQVVITLKRGSEERPPSLTERMRAQSSRRSRYWQVVIGLSVLGVALLVFWPARRERSMLPMPSAAKPPYRVLETRDMPADRVDRLSVFALVEPGMVSEDLRAALDWLLYSALDEANRQKKRFVRVVWAYLLEDAELPVSKWRAMAIWVDPRLPQSRRPAGPGGDAVKDGPTVYDFTNPVTAAEKR